MTGLYRHMVLRSNFESTLIVPTRRSSAAIARKTLNGKPDRYTHPGATLRTSLERSNIDGSPEIRADGRKIGEPVQVPGGPYPGRG